MRLVPFCATVYRAELVTGDSKLGLCECGARFRIRIGLSAGKVEVKCISVM